jgi:hypothetical protein
VSGLRSFNHCRFCGEWRGELVKYGVRHEAHLGCALGKQGMRWVRRLIEHPGLRWKLQDVTVRELIEMLPEKERTIATLAELNQLLGREESWI